MQKLTLGPSLWLYSNRIGPSTARRAGVQPADIIMESLWLILSRRPDGLEHFSIRFLLPGSNPEYCPKDLLPRMNKFSENVLQPLWPMLTRLKRGQKKCAMLVSFGSRIFGNKIWGGFGTQTGNGYYAILQKAHIPTDIIFDETIQRDGLKGYKMLFMHDIKHLPESVYSEINRFALNGSKVVCGKPFSNMIPNAFVWDPDMVKYKKSTYYSIKKGGGYTADQVHELLNSNAQFINEKFIKAIKPFANSPSMDIYLNTLENDGVKYLFAVNDKRDFGDCFGKKYRAVLDKGLPLQTIIKLNVKNPVIYDLLQHCMVKYEQTAENAIFKVDLPPAGGALFAIYDRAIDSLKLNIPISVVRGQKHLLKITVCDANNQPMPGTQPLRTIITAPDGTESEFSGYYATDKGQCQVKFNPAMNDIAGAWSITVVELSSGLEVKQLFSVR
jgi:hypothetical protein